MFFPLSPTLLLHYHSSQSFSLYLCHLLSNYATCSTVFILLFSISITYFPIMFSSNSHFLSAFHLSVFEAGYGKAVKHGDIDCNVVVFLLLDIDGGPTKVGSLILCGLVDDPNGSLHRAMQNQPLWFCIARWGPRLSCHSVSEYGLPFFQVKRGWQRGFTTLSVPLMEAVKYLPRDAREKRKSGAIRVSFQSGRSQDWTTSARPVYSHIFSVRNCPSSLTSLLTQDEMFPFPPRKYRKDSLRRNWQTIGSCLRLRWRERSLSYWRALHWQGSSFYSQPWTLFGLPATIQ